MTPESGTQPKRVIKERISTRAIEALMSNYRDAQQAFLELIDNAVDNRTDDQPLKIRIRVSRDELSIHNQGGRGLDFEGLENFFVWGYSEKTQSEIGYYGVGGKAAMGYLGRSMRVVCSPKGSSTEYEVDDPSWESRPEDQWKEFEPQIKKTDISEGYFRVRVTNLKREVNGATLAAKLGDIYRPLILEGKVEVRINGRVIEPLEIKYAQSEKDFLPQQFLVQTKFGDHIPIKIGVLEEGQRVRSGIRCYYRGRLIEDEEFFGHPTPAQVPQLSRFIGEADLDFVPVTSNKASFIRSSVQWKHTESRLREVLKPWVVKIQTLKSHEKSPVESYEKDLAKKAKRVLEDIFARTGIVSKSQLTGEAEGRRPAFPPSGERKTPTGKPGGPGPKEGQTAPHITATIGEMKRWGALFAWEVGSMGSEGRRSEIIEEEGKRKILKINSDHPLYQAEKKAGESALEIYMAETAVLRIAQEVCRNQTIEEYSELVNRLSHECGITYRSRISARRK